MRLVRILALACVALGLTLVAPLPSRAQDEVPLDNFNIMRFSPAPGPRNYFQVEGASTPGHIQGSAGLVIDYGHMPFVLYDASCRPDGTDCTIEGTREVLARYTAAAHIMGSFALWDRLQIGLVVPLVLTSGDEFAYSDPAGNPVILPSGTAFGLSDPRLSVKGRIYTHEETGISIGASAFVTFPTGQSAIGPVGDNERRWIGDALPTFGGHIIGEIINSGVHASINIGGMWREENTLFSTVVGPQLTYGLGLGYDITTLIGVFGELVGASTFSSQTDEHNLEWRVGGRLRVDDFDINLAGGSGFPGVAGVGTPLFRIIGGFQWAPIHADSDGDGIEDSADSCPSEAEDVDNWEDEDGCPEADNDGDGRADGDDPCPNEAEDADGFEDDDGCPDNDNDGDGIHDGYDSCPDAAEDVDEDRDEDGCPDNDTDRDGIEDPNDQCVDQPEDFDGFGDEDGCPEEDFDNDGRPDVDDQCPDQAEDADGFEDEDGCPEEGGSNAPAAAAAPEAAPEAAPAARRRRR